MIEQMSLFDALHAPPLVIPVEPHGAVIAGEVDTHLFLRHPRLAWHLAEIELHPHEGMWMWSASFNCDNHGSSYRVGPKWGKFAANKADALFYAVKELEERMAGKPGPVAAQIIAWARGLSI